MLDSDKVRTLVWASAFALAIGDGREDSEAHADAEHAVHAYDRITADERDKRREWARLGRRGRS